MEFFPAMFVFTPFLPTNLRQHLKRAHKLEFSELTRIEKEKLEKESQRTAQWAVSLKVSHQLTLAESIKPIVKKVTDTS